MPWSSLTLDRFLIVDIVIVISPASPELSVEAHMAAEVSSQIANAHTVFNNSNTLWFIGIAGASRCHRPRRSEISTVNPQTIGETPTIRGRRHLRRSAWSEPSKYVHPAHRS